MNILMNAFTSANLRHLFESDKYFEGKKTVCHHWQKKTIANAKWSLQKLPSFESFHNGIQSFNLFSLQLM